MMLVIINKAIKDIIGFELGLEFSNRYGEIAVSPGELEKASRKKNRNVEDMINDLGRALPNNLKETVKRTEYINGFFNIYLTDKAIVAELLKIKEGIDSYIINRDIAGQTIVFDYSSPNIAKPFSVGHLRSTIIGQANLNCHQAIGYKTVGINHIGDWGTQFGKLIVAIKKWGDEDKIKKDPIASLNKLYIRFHNETEKDPKLEDEAREWFAKLENNDAEARRLWEKSVKWSLAEFDQLYKKLGIKIDYVLGESFYISMLEDVVSELRDKDLLIESEGALVVELDDLPPALIRKTDGTTLYLTRDLAALKYRIEKYKPVKIIYHVGNDQSLHFRQLQEVAKKLGWLAKTEIVFAGHGLLRLPEGKMSTRAGRVILLDDLIDQAVQKSVKIIEEKNPELSDKIAIAQKIGVSAIKYSDLSQNRKSDIVFSFEKAITMEGNSAPYIQYAYARMTSLINKFKNNCPSLSPDEAPENEELAKLLIKTPSVLLGASVGSNPNIICKHAYKISNSFNSYYEKNKIITKNEDSTRKKIFIVFIAREVLGKLLDILGLSRLDKI